MFVIRLLIFFILSVYIKQAQAGYACPSNMLVNSAASAKSTSNRNFAYECACPNGKRINFDINSGKMKFGSCPDVGEIEFDVRKMPSGGIMGNPLFAWYDAADFNGDQYLTTARMNGIKVQYWKDKSGNGRDLIQTSVSNQPELTTVNVNSSMPQFSKPGLLFENPNANEDIHMVRNSTDINDLFNPNNGMTVFIVFENKPYTPTQNLSFIWSYYSSASDNISILRNHPSFSDSIRFVFNRIQAENYETTYDNLMRNHIDSFQQTVNPASTDENSSNLVSAIYDPDGYINANGDTMRKIDLYLNPFQMLYNGDNDFLSPHMQGKQNLFNVITVDSTPLNTNRMYIGSHGTGSRGFYGKINELIIFRRALTNGERDEIETYLRRKWNISANGPRNPNPINFY